MAAEWGVEYGWLGGDVGIRAVGLVFCAITALSNLHGLSHNNYILYIGIIMEDLD